MKLMGEKKEAKKKSARALVLFSGGLDSILAVKILEGQEIDVTPITFTSYFWNAQQAEKSARENKLKLEIVDFSHKHFEMIRKPKYGRGVGMNPCIDCHLLMLKVAKKIAREAKFDFIATGEVLGQRPMSQNFRALELIERKAGLVGKILRPLSAKDLPETEIEKTGMISREKLFGISGRGRKGQIELAKKYKIKFFPTPAGGCILTDKEYSKKLQELFENIKKPEPCDIRLLKIGRHFWIEKTRIILGRNHEENLALKKIAQKRDILIEPKGVPGPTALVRGKEKTKGMKIAKEKIMKYAKKSAGKPPVFNVSQK
jgi:tRNA-uridine 2-sulfurtransferase